MPVKYGSFDDGYPETVVPACSSRWVRECWKPGLVPPFRSWKSRHPQPDSRRKKFVLFHPAWEDVPYISQIQGAGQKFDGV